MIRPTVLEIRPSPLVASVGGALGTILISALDRLGPALGFPAIESPCPGAATIDAPCLIGGVLVGDPAAAFWLGYAIFFLVGWLVLAPALALLWSTLPGDDIRFTGATAKGLLWGLALFAASGLLLPLAGAVNRLGAQGLENPGFFALGLGPSGALGLLLAHLAYGLAVALVCAMTRGLSPLALLGWMGTGESARTPEVSGA